MHPALRISEILSVIFGFTTTLDDQRGNLSRAMKTCKTFYELAADVLWHTLDDLTPLEKCMPPELWYVDRQRAAHETLYRDIVVSFF